MDNEKLKNSIQSYLGLNFDLTQISQISDMEKLISLWENSSFDPQFKELIESRIVEVLNEISDIGKLSSLWENSSSDLQIEEFIESRIVEVLNEISDMEKLISLLENNSKDSQLKNIIESRMIKLVENLSMENLPEWFEKVLDGKLNLPTDVELIFKNVAGKFLRMLQKNFLGNFDSGWR